MERENKNKHNWIQDLDRINPEGLPKQISNYRPRIRQR
jgi:hypothetical protein